MGLMVPGFGKRRKHSGAQRNPNALAIGQSARPTAVFNNNEMRYIAGITYLREYSDCVYLLEPSRWVAYGEYATNFLNDAEEGNGHMHDTDQRSKQFDCCRNRLLAIAIFRDC